ncbi:hypothetical protein PILCRDRAFT_260173 [Piloderma croceum F 1598]|uniref:Uncharacterized protein n=1 Tax=Piloderma croceum (strain F 1598) TaxID=765440 RepID=A0A0C3GAT8_PILCF|nr:hypothetical protein PILCRDRAFT_260173 [Piloderma croceum F 1598]
MYRRSPQQNVFNQVFIFARFPHSRTSFDTMSIIADGVNVTQLATQEIRSQYARSSVKGKAAAALLEIDHGMELLIEHQALVGWETYRHFRQEQQKLAQTAEQVELTAHFPQKWLPHHMTLARRYKQQGKKFRRDVEISIKEAQYRKIDEEAKNSKQEAVDESRSKSSSSTTI